MIKLKPLKVGVIFDQQIFAGGGYQQSLNAALIAKKIPKELADVLFFTTIKENVGILSDYNIDAEFLKISSFSKVKNFLRARITNRYILSLFKLFEKYSTFEQKLKNRKIDLVYFLSPSNLAQILEELNYITTVWDLCHLDNPEFPEVRFNKEFDNRELIYKSILPKATAILVDSENGKTNLSNYYGINSERVKVMPFEPAISININLKLEKEKKINVFEKYKLDIPYVFYPAQFWSHKNHIYLIKGLFLLNKNYGLKVGAIFSGTDKNNLEYIKYFVKELKLENLVRFTGFVSNDEMVELYKNSMALVMPSYFGSTNLPPLEAFSLGVPVLYPDLRGLRDQVGDAALLIDLKDPNSMAINLKSLIEDKQLSRKLISAGYERLKYFNNNYDRLGILSKILENFRNKSVCWKYYKE